MYLHLFYEWHAENDLILLKYQWKHLFRHYGNLRANKIFVNITNI